MSTEMDTTGADGQAKRKRPDAGDNAHASTKGGQEHGHGDGNPDEMKVVPTDKKSAVTNTFNAHHLKQYYQNLFPIALVFRWLSYGDQEYILRREFTFWRGDRPMRYLCYKNKDQFKKDLLRKMPEKVDFGGVYNASPTLRDSVKDFQPESKELVFDIDMTDYDDVRNCCEGAAICQRCWQLMTCAVKVLDAALREDFGFNHLLWVFSGRRGIHCWISDERARYLKQAEREAIVSYLSVYMGTDKNRTVDVGYGAHMHPTLHRAFETLLPIFEQFILPEQGLLESEDSCEEFLSFIDAKERSYFQWEDMDVAPEVKWEELKKLVQTHVRQKGKRANNSVRHVIAKIVFYYTYPRLDIGVSKHLNHLLKSPFSVHPKTGNVCVPMLAKDIDVFNPFQVPTLAQLHEQLNAAVTDDLQLKMYERTSLKPYVEMLQDYVLGLENEKRAQKAKAKANRGGNTGVETMDF